jgi:hypothetical protein
MIHEHSSFDGVSSNPCREFEGPFLNYSDVEFDARLLVLQRELGQDRIQRMEYLANLNKKASRGLGPVKPTTQELYDPASFKYEQVKAQYEVNIDQMNNESLNQQREQDERDNKVAAHSEHDLELINNQILREQREAEERDRARIQQRLREQNLVMTRVEQERAEMERLGKIKLEMEELARQLIEKEKLKKEMLEKQRWVAETLKMGKEQYNLLKQKVRDSGLSMAELLGRMFDEHLAEKERREKLQNC